MPNLSEEGNRLVDQLAQRHNLSTDAVTHMLIAVYNGNGTMAQFSHPEFGGAGQWMSGGMTMVSDLFNNALKARVNNLCSDLSNSLAQHQSGQFGGSFQSQNQGGTSMQSQAVGAGDSTNDLFKPDPATQWWPNEFGTPSARGSQNRVAYAYFPSLRRLAVSTDGDVWVYDTLQHQIGGFSQQQGVGGSITFSSQFGDVSLSSLPVVTRNGVPQTPCANPVTVANSSTNRTPNAGPPNTSLDSTLATNTAPTLNMQPPQFNSPAKAPSGSEDIIDTLERLGALKEKGYISDEEFASKKAELLSRL